MALQETIQDKRQETRQALKLLARLMRTTPEAAASWVYRAGLDEHQTRMIGAVIEASPFFQGPPRPIAVLTRAKCPECGQWFAYTLKTKRRVWCTEACRLKARRRQAAQKLPH